MYATYDPINPDNHTLNVRSEPRAGSEVIGGIAAGQTVEVESVERGWCKLSDGYVDARFVTVTAGDGETESDADGESEDGSEGASADAGELRDMTNSQLRKLAEDSGIKVKGNLGKEALIAAILGDD